MGLSDLWVLIMTILVALSSGLLVYGFIRDRHDPFDYHKISDLARQQAHELARSEVRMMQMESKIEECDHGATLLLQFIRARGWTPPWLPTQAHHIDIGNTLLLPLYELFYDRFTDDEMKDLAFRINAPSDAMTGDTHSARARSLVEYVNRHKLVDEILKAGREERPELSWPEIHD